MTDAHTYTRATFSGGPNCQVWIGPVRIGHLEWNKRRESPFARFVPSDRCPQHLAQVTELRGEHQTMKLRRLIWEKQEAHARGTALERDQPIPLPIEQDPRAAIEAIARDLMARGTDAEDRRQGRRLLGAVQAMWAEDGADPDEDGLTPHIARQIAAAMQEEPHS